MSFHDAMTPDDLPLRHQGEPWPDEDDEGAPMFTVGGLSAEDRGEGAPMTIAAVERITPLAQKLAAVMGAVGRIPKRGRNAFHGYDYATEADIADAIRHLLAEHHVILVPEITAIQREPVGEKGSVLTTIMMEFTFIDGDSGETITRRWAGAGTDKEDKGIYKAMTGGEKYFLLKTFLLPTGDDPEADDKKPGKVADVDAPAKPTDYERWRSDLDACADTGRVALRDMWAASRSECREYLKATEPDAITKLRERAKKADRVPA